jgi:putative oxidoreductase
MRDVAALILRVTVGGLLAGHGAQKLFGWFGGPGLEGTAKSLESLGLKPGERWAPVAAASEFGGGVLTALGLLGPLGPIGILAAMSTATLKAHWGKPIWSTAGGAELPVTNMAAALALALAGPGRYSLDALARLRVPPAAVAAAAVAAAAGLAVTVAAPAALSTGSSEHAAGAGDPA